MLELERTFLAQVLPQGLAKCPSKAMVDIYLPKGAKHPILRIRKNGDNYELTKKFPSSDDHSCLTEETVVLTKEEYEALAGVDGKRVEKRRYLYQYKGKVLEIDVFGGPLKGLVLVDAEFGSEAEKRAFPMPSFCLCEVTQEEVIAGGFLAGRSLADIAPVLKRHGYTSL